MLIEFRLENHRSVRDEQVLTLATSRRKSEEDPRARDVVGHSAPLLTAAAIYGANASGKSNLLSGIAFMREAVLTSHRRWDPEGGVSRTAFAWGAKAAEPSLFEVEILIAGVRYQYGFVADDERFLEEWLYAWPTGRKQKWFEREGDEFKFGEHLHGENSVVKEITRPNALFLSAAAQHSHQQLIPLYRWFHQLRAVNVRRGRPSALSLALNWHRSTLHALGGGQRTLFDHDERGWRSFRDLLRAADIGIVDVKLEKDAANSADRGASRRGSGILVRHSSSNEDAWLPLEEESQGTLTLFEMGPALLETLHAGGVLLVDELEASLHPLIGLELLRNFNDPDLNPMHAQLLFTTHDTNLLGSVTGKSPLRRDQVWLTEKDKEGATTLYPLTDYKPRKAENLERGYLQGRYGAIPYLGELVRHQD